MRSARSAREALEVVERLRADMASGLTASAGVVAWPAAMAPHIAPVTEPSRR